MLCFLNSYQCGPIPFSVDVQGSNELGRDGVSVLVGVLGKMINLKWLGMVGFSFTADVSRKKHHGG